MTEHTPREGQYGPFTDSEGQELYLMLDGCWIFIQAEFGKHCLPQSLRIKFKTINGEQRVNINFPLKYIPPDARPSNVLLDAETVDDLPVMVNLEEMAGEEPSHSPDFRMVRSASGTTWSLTPMQSRVVELLWVSWEMGMPELGQAYMLTEVGSKADNLKAVFSNSDAWETLIVSGETKGTYRLALD